MCRIHINYSLYIWQNSPMKLSGCVGSFFFSNYCSHFRFVWYFIMIKLKLYILNLLLYRSLLLLSLYICNLWGKKVLNDEHLMAHIQKWPYSKIIGSLRVKVISIYFYIPLDGQGGLSCCSSWVAKSRTWLSDWTELNWT